MHIHPALILHKQIRFALLFTFIHLHLQISSLCIFCIYILHSTDLSFTLYFYRLSYCFCEQMQRSLVWNDIFPMLCWNLIKESESESFSSSSTDVQIMGSRWNISDTHAWNKSSWFLCRLVFLSTCRTKKHRQPWKFGNRHLIWLTSTMKNTNRHVCDPRTRAGREKRRRYNLYNTCNKEFIALSLKNSWHVPSISPPRGGKTCKRGNKRNRCSSCSVFEDWELQKDCQLQPIVWNYSFGG